MVLFKEDGEMVSKDMSQDKALADILAAPQDKRLRALTCCCCGERTKGRQWYNRDKGYGLCPKCANWIKDGNRETPEEMHESYGIEGVHYGTENA